MIGNNDYSLTAPYVCMLLIFKLRRNAFVSQVQSRKLPAQHKRTGRGECCVLFGKESLMIKPEAAFVMAAALTKITCCSQTALLSLSHISQRRNVRVTGMISGVYCVLRGEPVPDLSVAAPVTGSILS